MVLLQEAEQLASGVGFRQGWRCVNTAEGYWLLVVSHSAVALIAQCVVAMQRASL